MEPPIQPDLGRVLTLLDEHRRGLHATDARAECSRCVTEPLLDESDLSDHEVPGRVPERTEDPK